MRNFLRFHKDRNEYYLTVEGVFSTPYIVLTQTAIFTAIAIYFGLNEVSLGLAASFPMAFQIFQIFAPSIIERIPSKKILLGFFNSGRFLWLILIPYLFAEHKPPEIFITVFAISQIFAALAGNVWISIVYDTISPERRGKYLGLRNFFVSLMTLLTFYSFSLINDSVKKPYSFLFIIVATEITTVISLMAIAPIEEKRSKRTGTFNDLKIVLSDKNFIKLSRAYFFWNFVVLMAAPFFPYHQLNNLKLPMTYISYASITASLLSMLFYTLWGKLADEFGHKSVLIAGLSIVSVTPAIWILMNERDWILALVLDAILSGVGWAAVNLSIITLPMETASTNSPMYFAVFSALGGLGGMLGSIIGGPIARMFNQFDFHIGEFHIFGLQVFFIIESILRYLTIPLFAKIVTKKYVTPSTLFTNAISILSGRQAIRIQEGTRSEVVIGRKRVNRWW
ncbi:MAG: MFS transporter [Fervidobacterium sp.]|uniref:MFS transporter n=1 Tax=Fervidobacterium sp. TaxID=1871331 RepID=UPI00404B1533